MAWSLERVKKAKPERRESEMKDKPPERLFGITCAECEGRLGDATEWFVIAEGQARSYSTAHGWEEHHSADAGPAVAGTAECLECDALNICWMGANPKGEITLVIHVGDGMQSKPERVFWRMWQSQGINEDKSGDLELKKQVQIGKYRIDFGFPDRKIGIEVDGLAYHNGQETFVADRKRQRWIEAQGWRVIRFAAVEILNDPQACVNEVVEMFEGASNG